MFEKVLVPTDFSKYAQKVVECIGDVPGIREIVLLNVVARDPLARTWDPVAEARDAEKKVAAEARGIKAPNVAVKARAVSALEGDVAGMINTIADRENVDLVMMGARGKSIIQSAILGSSSRNVLRFGDRNLLIMRYKTLSEAEKGTFEKYCAHIFSKVLVPTDLSEPSEAAISMLRSIPGIGEIILLHVISKGETKEEIDTDTANATERLNEIASTLSGSGLNVRSQVVVGNAIEEIRAMAEKEDVSLISMSSQGRAALKSGRIGSTAYDVANSSSRPVLILRPGAPILT